MGGRRLPTYSDLGPPDQDLNPIEGKNKTRGHHHDLLEKNKCAPASSSAILINETYVSAQSQADNIDIIASSVIMKLGISTIVSFCLLLLVSTTDGRVIASRPPKNEDADESHAVLRALRNKARDDAMAPPSKAPLSKAYTSWTSPSKKGNRHRFLASPGFLTRPTRALPVNRVKVRDPDESIGARPRRNIDVPRRRRLRNNENDSDDDDDDDASADRAARPSVDSASALAIAIAAAHRVHNMTPER
jgi:hypothetical protein